MGGCATATRPHQACPWWRQDRHAPESPKDVLPWFSDGLGAARREAEGRESNARRARHGAPAVFALRRADAREEPPAAARLAEPTAIPRGPVGCRLWGPQLVRRVEPLGRPEPGPDVRQDLGSPKYQQDLGSPHGGVTMTRVGRAYAIEEDASYSFALDASALDLQTPRGRRVARGRRGVRGVARLPSS